MLSLALPLQDLALYGGLCALASFDRTELKSKVIDNVGFRELLELMPEVRRTGGTVGVAWEFVCERRQESNSDSWQTVGCEVEQIAIRCWMPTEHNKTAPGGAWHGAHERPAWMFAASKMQCRGQLHECTQGLRFKVGVEASRWT